MSPRPAGRPRRSSAAPSATRRRSRSSTRARGPGARASTPTRRPRRSAKSRTALTHALQSGDAIGAHAVVLHAGSALAGDVDRAIVRAGQVVREAMAESSSTPLHFENTAGAGGTLGRSFEELAALIDAAGGGERLGICLDSC